jgi:hypothetical protein
VSGSIKLITGIPRSGTTLCCKLLNEKEDIVALHEPIEPSSLFQSTNPQQAVEAIAEQIANLDQAITHGLPFVHGDKGGLDISNPVGENLKGGIRQVEAKRGQIQLKARDANSYQLVVKQNALFTALIDTLSQRYPMVCIVRNPVDVLASWLSVDLPVNRGRIPAGEHFDSSLKQALDVTKNSLSRQLYIYQWFVDKFRQSGLPIIRYEDVLVSGGVVLDHALGLTPIERDSLAAKERTFHQSTLAKLELALPKLLVLDLGDLYTKQDIQLSFDRVIGNGFLSPIKELEDDSQE